MVQRVACGPGCVVEGLLAIQGLPLGRLRCPGDSPQLKLHLLGLARLKQAQFRFRLAEALREFFVRRRDDGWAASVVGVD